MSKNYDDKKGMDPCKNCWHDDGGNGDDDDGGDYDNEDNDDDDDRTKIVLHWRPQPATLPQGMPQNSIL